MSGISSTDQSACPFAATIAYKWFGGGRTSLRAEFAGQAMQNNGANPTLDDRLSLLDRPMSGQLDRYGNQPDHAPRFMAVMGKTGILDDTEKH